MKDDTSGNVNIPNNPDTPPRFFPETGFGAHPAVDIAVTSWHVQGSKNHQTFNEFSFSRPLSNPGIGLSVDTGVTALGAPVRAEAAIYNNSYAKPTAYVAASWQPLKLDLPAGLRANFGAVAGLATGYKGHVPKEYEMGPFVPILAPRMSVEHEKSGIAVNATIIPGLTARDASAIAFSVSKKF